MDLNSVAARVSEVLGIKVEDVWAKGRYRRIVEARSLLCYYYSRFLHFDDSVLSIR
jgi:chromosomal replication initiation ATPase DnaA